MALDEVILEDIQEVISSSSLSHLPETPFQSEITPENGEVYLFQYLSLLEKQLTSVSLVSQLRTFLTQSYDVLAGNPQAKATRSREGPNQNCRCTGSVPAPRSSAQEPRCKVFHCDICTR